MEDNSTRNKIKVATAIWDIATLNVETRDAVIAAIGQEGYLRVAKIVRREDCAQRQIDAINRKNLVEY